jgi:hypothetical protein
MKYLKSNLIIHHELPIPSRILNLVRKFNFSSGARASASGKLAMFMVCKCNPTLYLVVVDALGVHLRRTPAELQLVVELPGHLQVAGIGGG